MSTSDLAFGIDIGGSGIKGAVVDLRTGELSTDRLRIPTPQPSVPDAVADTVVELLDSFELPKQIPVGITFPAVVQHGVTKTAANVDPSWIDTNIETLLERVTGRDVFVVNDADAAGIAEMEFGAGRDRKGVVLMTTLGTGVGSALFLDGTLVPNTELGHLILHGDSAEKYMASSVKDKLELSYEEWADRLQEYYAMVERVLWPDLIIVGGGVSKHHAKYLPRLALNAEIIPAKLLNNAGIVGAAALAHSSQRGEKLPVDLQPSTTSDPAKKSKDSAKGKDKKKSKGRKKKKKS